MSGMNITQREGHISPQLQGVFNQSNSKAPEPAVSYGLYTFDGLELGNKNL